MSAEKENLLPHWLAWGSQTNLSTSR